MLEKDILIQSSREARDAALSSFYLRLKDQFPGSFILETDHWSFSPDELGESPPWTFSPDPGHWARSAHAWNSVKQRIQTSPLGGWYQATFAGGSVRLARFEQILHSHPSETWFIIADSEDAAKGFFSLVSDFHSQIRGEILVFSRGCWSSSRSLYEAVHQSKLDDLVLAKKLKEQIVEDLELFLSQEEAYLRYRIPYKRGALFLGPPGNGKTHLIRALASHFRITCLYVKSFESQMGSQYSIAQAFERARQVGRCLFVFEDLDTLLTASNRTYFLNELDGFASNHGIITIATCNFAELLDPAITERPSRFDRKYHFDLPIAQDRTRFLTLFQQRFEPEMRLDESELAKVSEAAEGYSYAYLKELMASSAMHWLSFGGAQPFGDVVMAQTATLREQMRTEWAQMKNAPPASSQLEEYGCSDDD